MSTAKTFVIQTRKEDFLYGSRSEVKLDEPYYVPVNARNLQVTLHSAEVWNTIPNILAAQNQLKIVKGDNTIVDLTIPPGQYSVALLQKEIARQLLSSSPPQPASLLQIEGNPATASIIFTSSDPGSEVQFFPNSIPILGCSPGDIIRLPIAGAGVSAPNRAEFNEINNIFVLCDLAGQGLDVSGRSSGLIGKIPIQAPPGYQILFQPNTPLPIDATHLRGTKIRTILSTLMDDSLRVIDTNEVFTLVYLLTYDV